MEGHCDCCRLNEANAVIADLKDTNESLRIQLKECETLKDDLNRELSDAQEAAEEAEGDRDDAQDNEERKHRELRDEKAKHLEALRSLEFCLDGICVVCLGGIRVHGVGCKIKLEIFRLDHELNRSEYVHL